MKLYIDINDLGVDLIPKMMFFFLISFQTWPFLGVSMLNFTKYLPAWFPVSLDELLHEKDGTPGIRQAVW